MALTVACNYCFIVSLRHRSIDFGPSFLEITSLALLPCDDGWMRLSSCCAPRARARCRSITSCDAPRVLIAIRIGCCCRTPALCRPTLLSVPKSLPRLSKSIYSPLDGARCVGPGLPFRAISTNSPPIASSSCLERILKTVHSAIETSKI